jgi:hypothetical protein
VEQFVPRASGIFARARLEESRGRAVVRWRPPAAGLRVAESVEMSELPGFIPAMTKHGNVRFSFPVLREETRNEAGNEWPRRRGFLGKSRKKGLEKGGNERAFWWVFVSLVGGERSNLAKGAHAWGAEISEMNGSFPIFQQSEAEEGEHGAVGAKANS